MLSDAGLAPILYQLVQLPGGFMQVSLVLDQVAAYSVDSSNRLSTAPCDCD